MPGKFLYTADTISRAPVLVDSGIAKDGREDRITESLVQAHLLASKDCTGKLSTHVLRFWSIADQAGLANI